MGQFALNTVAKTPTSVLQQPWVSFLIDIKIILLGSVAISCRNISIEISIISIGTGESPFPAEVLQFSAAIKYSSHIWLTALWFRQAILQVCSARCLVQRPWACLPGWLQVVWAFRCLCSSLIGCKPCFLQKSRPHMSIALSPCSSQPGTAQPQPTSHDTKLAISFPHEP